MTASEELCMLQKAIKQADRLVRQAYNECIEQGLLPYKAEPKGSIALTKDVSLGDLACPYAIAYGKHFKLEPYDVARTICLRLSLDDSYFHSAEPALNGFINLRFSDKWYAAVLAQIDGTGGGFKINIEARGDKAHIFFNANNGIREEGAGPALIKSVRLVRNKEPVKQTDLELSRILEGVAGDSARFYLLLNSDTQLELDVDVIRRSDGGNKLYYIIYAHKRITSLIKSKMAAACIMPANIAAILLSTDLEKALIRQLALFNDEACLAERELDPTRLCRYLNELASGFYSYYKAVKLRAANDDLIAARYRLLYSIKTVIEKGLDILGIAVIA